MPSQTDLNLTSLTAGNFALSMGVGAFEAGGSQGGHGLRSTFYKSHDENNKSKLIRASKSVRNIDFDWKDKGPQNVPVDSFSATFEGILTPEASGDYEFIIKGDDRATLWLDGREIVNLKTTGEATGSLKLIANKAYKFRFRYQEDSGGASIKLYWQTANIPKEIIPQSRYSMPLREKKDLPTGIKTIAIGPNKRKFKMSINQLGTSLYAQMKTPPVPGVFKLEIPTMFANDLSWLFENKSTLIPFVVSLNREESRMSALSDGALADITKYVDIMSTTKLEDVQASVEGKSFGKEIWRFFAVGVLFLVIAEIVLSRWIAIQRRTGKKERVNFEDSVDNK
jgi:hypothetical protein